MADIRSREVKCSHQLGLAVLLAPVAAVHTSRRYLCIIFCPNFKLLQLQLSFSDLASAGYHFVENRLMQDHRKQANLSTGLLLIRSLSVFNIFIQYRLPTSWSVPWLNRTCVISRLTKRFLLSSTFRFHTARPR
jgi:hypothetical protein